MYWPHSEIIRAQTLASDRFDVVSFFGGYTKSRAFSDLVSVVNMCIHDMCDADKCYSLGTKGLLYFNCFI